MFKIYNKKRATNHLFSRFGIDQKYFDDYLFFSKNKSVFIISKEKEEIIKKIIKNRFVVNLGIELFSDIKHFVPSSLGFGVIDYKEIKQNYVILKRKEIVDYLNGKEIVLENVLNKNILSEGFIICIYDEHIVGTCLYKNKKLIPNLAFVNQKAK